MSQDYNEVRSGCAVDRYLIHIVKVSEKTAIFQWQSSYRKAAISCLGQILGATMYYNVCVI